jgi:hypothetical protein
MEIPHINKLSGTMPSELLETYIDAKQVVSRAIEAVGRVWPNGRDYQGGSINKAMEEHSDRIKRLRQVAAELETIAEGIVNQL